MDFKKASLNKYGFRGFVSIGHLKEDLSIVPKTKGVYIVFRERLGIKLKDFLPKSTGGPFKGKDPTLDPKTLKLAWVDNAHVLYIGKAGGSRKNGKLYKSTLFSRIKQYMQFGKGKAVGHWGGRAIWQLKDQNELLIAWKELIVEEPLEVEASLIKKFEKKFKKRPFANMDKKK